MGPSSSIFKSPHAWSQTLPSTPRTPPTRPRCWRKLLADQVEGAYIRVSFSSTIKPPWEGSPWSHRGLNSTGLQDEAWCSYQRWGSKRQGDRQRLDAWKICGSRSNEFDPFTAQHVFIFLIYTSLPPFWLIVWLFTCLLPRGRTFWTPRNSSMLVRNKGLGDQETWVLNVSSVTLSLPNYVTM